MPVMRGRRALLEMLRAEGVEYVFGNPGTSESPIMDELESFPDLKYTLVMQEGVAMGMADAYARATGRPSFINLHIETGLGNGMSLLHNAFDGGTPLVLTSGNKDIREFAMGRTDVSQMVRVLTKWTSEIVHPSQVPHVMRRAFKEAKTPPTGPVYVGFAANAMDDEADMEILPSAKGYFRTQGDSQAIEAAADVLAGASNPLIILGDSVGQSGASGEAVRLAELIGAPVYASTYSEMCYPTSHAHYKGPIRIGFPGTKERLSEADAVLMVGKLANAYYMFSSPELRFVGPDTKLVHINSDPSDVGRTQPTEVGIIADPKVGMDQLADAVDATMTGSAREAAKGRSAVLAEEKAAARAAYQQHVKDRWDGSPMSAERMMAEIARALPDDTIIVNDAVTSAAALFGALDFDEPGSIIGGRGGALGWGMGGILGMKLANPDRPVVGVLGDGSAMMTVQGLWTAANENIPVVYVMCNNSSYRVLKLNMNIYKETVRHQSPPQSAYMAMDFPLPLDLAAMAEANGVHGRRIEDPTELGPAMEHGLGLGKPAVLDVVIDGSV